MTAPNDRMWYEYRYMRAVGHAEGTASIQSADFKKGPWCSCDSLGKNPHDLRHYGDDFILVFRDNHHGIRRLRLEPDGVVLDLKKLGLYTRSE